MTGEEPLRCTWRAHALQTKGSAEVPAGRAAALPRPAPAPGLSGCSDREETTEHGGHRRANPAGVTTTRAWTPAPRSVQAASGGRAHLPGPARGPSRLKTAAPPQPRESSRARPPSPASERRAAMADRCPAWLQRLAPLGPAERLGLDASRLHLPAAWSPPKGGVGPLTERRQAP